MKKLTQPKQIIQQLEQRVDAMYSELKSLKGKEFDEKVREIHNLQVDITMKKRQITTSKYQACYSDEVQAYYLPNL